MKSCFLLAGLMIFFSANSQIIHNTTRYNITPFTFRCCQELDLDSCLIFIDATSSSIGFGLQGHSREIDKGYSYAILVRNFLSFEQTEKVIAHELVHIKQLKTRMLRFDSDSIRFNDKTYPNIRWRHSGDEHEIQAVRIGEVLHEKYKNVLINYN